MAARRLKPAFHPTQGTQRTQRTQKSPAVARLADRNGCQWPSRSSKVNDFYIIWQGVCHFLY